MGVKWAENCEILVQPNCGYVPIRAAVAANGAEHKRRMGGRKQEQATSGPESCESIREREAMVML